MKRVLVGCVLCRDCANKISPAPIGILASRDMSILGYSGCKVDKANRLVEADRKCLHYKEVIK